MSNPRTPRTPEQRDWQRTQVAKLYGCGVSVKAIARRLDVTERTIQRDLAHLGMGAMRSNVQPDERDEMRAMRREGMSCKAIAKIMGRSDHAVRLAVGMP